jgi:hypothetical protein
MYNGGMNYKEKLSQKILSSYQVAQVFFISTGHVTIHVGLPRPHSVCQMIR